MQNNNEFNARDNAPATVFDIKRINRARVFKLIYEKGGLSRKEIQSTLSLSLPTINQNITELMEDGLLVQSGSIGYTGGRKAEAFSVNMKAKVAVGLDITINGCTAVLMDLSTDIIDLQNWQRPFMRDAQYLSFISDCVWELLGRNDINKDQILGVGVGLPALTDIESKRVVYSGIIDIGHITSQEIADVIGLPVMLFNDANAACFAELHEMNNSNASGFYVLLNNHVGGSVFINNQIFTGDAFRSGEIGHLIIHQGGKKCYCGRYGCLDSYCSDTVLTDVSGGDLDTFFEKLDDGDPDVLKVWDSYLDDLALAVRNVRLLFDCPVIIGGYVGGRIGKHISELKSKVLKINTFDTDSDFIKPCRYKWGAIAAGSAMKLISNFIESV